MPSTRPPRVEVHALLQTFPEGEIFQLLRDQVLAHSSVDPGKQWASSSSYLTFDKRTLTHGAMLEAVEAAFAADRAMQDALRKGCRDVVEALAGGDGSASARRIVELGEILERHERPDHAAACYDKALALSRGLSDSGPHLLALRRIARLSQAYGELDRACTHYETAYGLARDSRDAAECSASATGLGNVKVDQGKWEEAEQHYTAARLHAEEAGDDFQMGQLWNNLSVVRRRMGDLEGATDFSSRAIRIFEALGDAGELARCHNNLGLIQVEQREFARALHSYEKAVSLATRPYVVAAVRGNLCELYQREGQYLLAEEQGRLGEEIALRHGFVLILIHIYRLLGTLSRLREDPNGVTFFEKALEVSHRHNYLHAQAEVHFDYGLFRSGFGDADEANGHFEKARSIYRQLDARTDLQRVEERLAALSCGP
ncbi:MAG: tetratricopeptide repeat protein [Gemmatimonadetes bacterium]|nr:tetratricopeptide repeat protein [Gemmatimonadota bacterium]